MGHTSKARESQREEETCRPGGGIRGPCGDRSQPTFSAGHFACLVMSPGALVHKKRLHLEGIRYKGRGETPVASLVLSPYGGLLFRLEDFGGPVFLQTRLVFGWLSAEADGRRLPNGVTNPNLRLWHLRLRSV